MSGLLYRKTKYVAGSLVAALLLLQQPVQAQDTTLQIQQKPVVTAPAKKTIAGQRTKATKKKKSIRRKKVKEPHREIIHGSDNDKELARIKKEKDHSKPVTEVKKKAKGTSSKKATKPARKKKAAPQKAIPASTK